jgi:ATP-dependent RNA helicase DeaD
VEHIYYMVRADHRYLALKRIVDMNPDIYGIVFCRTRQETKDVAEKLMKDGYNADALHGDLSQAQRDTVMNKFRIKNLQVLVATDVAARGLDVSDLTHVINYNLPDDVEVYTHRSGRTGRAGKKGVSCVIVHTREGRRLREIERIIKKEFKRMPVPNGMEVCKRQLFHLIDKMERVEVSNEEIDVFMPQIAAKLEYLSKEEIISRFVSLEFNRFAEYYKDAEDINVDVKEGKKGKDKGDGKSKRGQKVRFKMLYGTKQNATPRSVLGVINDVTQDKSIIIGDIEITNKFTFFDVYVDQADKVKQAFEDAGEPLSVAEPREVVSKAPKAQSEKSNRKKEYRHDREERRGRERRNDHNDRDERRGRERRNDRNDRDERRDRRDNRRKEVTENPDKPWRRRR